MSKEPRTAQTNIRSYHRERREWVRAAERDGLELGSWCRLHLNQAARETPKLGRGSCAWCGLVSCQLRESGEHLCDEHYRKWLFDQQGAGEDGP